MNAPDRSRSLLFAGFLLFLLALFTGFAIPSLTNPRQGLASHMTGVPNGFFLILLGLCWERLRLGARAAVAVFILAVFAAYTNWAINLLGAIFGTGKLTPLVAGGRVGKPWQEALVNTGAYALAIAIVICLILVLWSLRKPGALSS
ncbi:MAG TPA: hydrogenase [Thermoanaerobaculia bacterium]|jgi:hydroxylaminobenzene mutase|nr:hydrogenase [Thermoanaerobaculia bacterium]